MIKKGDYVKPIGTFTYSKKYNRFYNYDTGKLSQALKRSEKGISVLNALGKIENKWKSRFFKFDGSFEVLEVDFPYAVIKLGDNKKVKVPVGFVEKVNKGGA